MSLAASIKVKLLNFFQWMRNNSPPTSQLKVNKQAAACSQRHNKLIYFSPVGSALCTPSCLKENQVDKTDGWRGQWVPRRSIHSQECWENGKNEGLEHGDYLSQLYVKNFHRGSIDFKLRSSAKEDITIQMIFSVAEGESQETSPKKAALPGFLSKGNSFDVNIIVKARVLVYPGSKFPTQVTSCPTLFSIL